MGYFKYTEDIIDAQEEARYFAEASETFIKVVDENSQINLKLKPIYERYYVLKKIIYELQYKTVLLDDLADIKSTFFKKLFLNEKKEYKENYEYLLHSTKDLYTYLLEEGFDVEAVSELTSSDKNNIKKNFCEYLCNCAFTYLNESSYMDASEIIKDIDALSYWSVVEKLTYDNPGYIKRYLKENEFLRRTCMYCGEDTAKECCYCLNCGALLGVEN